MTLAAASDRPDDEPAASEEAAASDRPDGETAADDRPAGSRRELGAAVLLCLVGAGLALFAGGRSWVTGSQPAPPPLPARHVALTAAGLRLPVRDLALLGLAAVPALLATKRWGRLLVGSIALLAAVVVVTVSLRTLAGPAAVVRAAVRSGAADGTSGGALAATSWPVVALLGGLLLGAGGALVIVRGRRWAALSARYDAPSVRARRPAAGGEVATWDALDRGEDPTDG